MMRPRLYVVDEPLANLDPATAERLLAHPSGPGRRGRRRASSSSTASRRRWTCGRIGSSISRKGRPATSAPSRASSRIADPGAVKLPFDVVLQRAPRRTGSRPPRPPVAIGVARCRARGRRDAASARVPRRRRVDRRHRILHGVDARLGRAEIVADPRAERLRQDHAFRTAMRLLRRHGRDDPRRRQRCRRADHGPARDDLRLRLPEPEPDAVRPDGPRGAAVRPHEPGPRSGDVRCPDRRTSSRGPRSIDLEDILERPPLALSFGQQKRLALAIALALRPVDADPRRAVRRPGSPHRRGVHARGRWRSPGSRACTSSRTTWTLH